ncbi:MAG: hypothetical protein WCC41_03820, partial [Rhodomicrobium sp.]
TFPALSIPIKGWLIWHPLGVTMRVFAALALTLALLSNAHAQSGGTTYKIGQICTFDIQQYCKGIPAKRIRDLKECLAKHEKDLLPRCQDHYKEAKP